MRCVIVTTEGPACRRCGRLMQVRAHERGSFYPRLWFYCTNKDCKTTAVTMEDYNVLNHLKARQAIQCLFKNQDEGQSRAPRARRRSSV